MPESDITITNGQPSRHPSVASLGTGDGFCSGTFIGANVVITAAHCNCGGRLFYEGRLGQVYDNPSYSCSTAYKLGHDIVLARFPGVKVPAMPLAAERPRRGDQVVLYGFGDTVVHYAGEGDGDHEEQVGFNEYDGRSKDSAGEERRGMIIIEGGTGSKEQANDRSSTGRGDSGGPLIKRGQLVGVLSGGQVESGWEGMSNVSYYVDLRSRQSREYLRQAVKDGFEIPSSCCSCVRSQFNRIGIESQQMLEIAVGTEQPDKLCKDTESIGTDYRIEGCQPTAPEQCEEEFGVDLSVAAIQ